MMYEVDFLPVGDGDKSGDAIGVRFTRPDTGHTAIVLIDAGFEPNGEALVEHVKALYGTEHVDLVISTHPDLDHIGGLGVVMRELNVGELWIHRPGLHGHPGNSGNRPAEQLVELAEAQGATVTEPFTGVNTFGQALVVAGPSTEYYEELLDEQAKTTKAASAPGARLVEAARRFGRRFLDAMPTETLFDDAGGTNPRNNSAVILDLQVEGKRFFFPSDAGVPAINAGLDALDYWGLTAQPITFLQVPHHGGRHNLDRNTADRLLGTPVQEVNTTAFVNVAPDSTRPRGKIVNALRRRGAPVSETRNRKIWHFSPDAPARPTWGPLDSLGWMDEDQ
jgi:Metallo-beta-lactamase superfamily